MDKELIIKKDFKIKNDADLGQSVVVLTKANNKLDELEEERKKITAPMREALAEVMSRYKPMTEELERCINIVRTEQGRYQTELIQTRLAEEKKIADRIGDGRGKISLTTAVEKMRQLEEVKNKIDTDIGSLGFTSKEVYEVMDIVMLMEKTGPEFVQPNDEKIKLAMKEGIHLPGVEYKVIQIPVNRRK